MPTNSRLQAPFCGLYTFPSTRRRHPASTQPRYISHPSPRLPSRHSHTHLGAMPKKKSLADELADLLNPAPAKGATSSGCQRCRHSLACCPPLLLWKRATCAQHPWLPVQNSIPRRMCLARGPRLRRARTRGWLLRQRLAGALPLHACGKHYPLPVWQSIYKRSCLPRSSWLAFTPSFRSDRPPGQAMWCIACPFPPAGILGSSHASEGC